MLQDKADIELLMKAAAAAGIPADKLKPEQPWKYTGKTAELLQSSVEMIAPEKAAQWRSDAGGCISLATQAAELGLQPHTAETKADLLKHDPRAVIQHQKEQEERDKALEQKLWAGAQELAAKNGNPDPRAAYEAEQSGKQAPFFGGGVMADARRRQWEYEQATGGWN